jgi:hypothetical protein
VGQRNEKVHPPGRAEIIGPRRRLTQARLCHELTRINTNLKRPKQTKRKAEEKQNIKEGKNQVHDATRALAPCLIRVHSRKFVAKKVSLLWFQITRSPDE